MNSSTAGKTYVAKGLKMPLYAVISRTNKKGARSVCFSQLRITGKAGE